MDHEELFTLHCQGEFIELKEGLAALSAAQAELLAALKGDGDKPGLCERVRSLERVYRRIWTGVALVLATVTVQVIVQVAAWLGRRVGG